jgi:phosphate transport system protein
MSHYEERMQADLDTIRGRVSEMGGMVESAVRNAVGALLRRDRALAASIVLADHPINRTMREVDALCHVFVARHIPSAGVLRTISAVLRLLVGLERIGDYAVTIARETAQLDGDVPDDVARDIDLVTDHSLNLLTQSLRAFDERNAELARGTIGLAGQGRRTSHRVFHDLVRVGKDDAPPLSDLFAMLLCINRLERIGDQAKNICEETIFAVTGETKQPKVYRIQFVDRANDAKSLIAEAVARKVFPESGVYSSSGWQPGAEIVPAVAEFLERHGHDVSELRPKAFDDSYGALEDFHVLVGLDGDVTERIAELPFHTTAVRWDAGPQGEDAERMQGEEWLTALYRDLSTRVSELMETLRGDQAR